MSFAASRNLLEPSFQSSKKVSGKVIDPKVQMRLLFPSGWDNKHSDVFRWYKAQSHKFFRKIQYYKEQQGVGHEFIVLPVQDAGGAPTNWFCRLERMANPAQQLAAIGADGTEAFDYIQSFDSIRQSSSELLGPLRGAELIAEVTLPRDFDLYDVLAICSAVAEHPQARRYTLQQYNCYFFCWAIILSLSRRSADWENMTLQQMNDVQASVLRSVAAPVPAENAKLAHILSLAHSSEKDSTDSLLSNALVSELPSPEFSRSAHEALSSVLWAHDGYAALKHGLKYRSQGLTEQTLDLLIGGLDVDLDAKIVNSLKGQADYGPGIDMQGLILEADAINSRKTMEILTTRMEKDIQGIQIIHKSNQIQTDSSLPLGRRALELAAIRFALRLNSAYFIPHYGVVIALGTALAHTKLAIHQRQNKGICILKCLGNTFRYLPSSVLFASKAWSLASLTKTMGHEGGFDPSGEANTIWRLSSLQLTISMLLPRLLKQDGTVIRAFTFQLLASILKETDNFNGMNAAELWDRLLWDFLGDIIAKAVFQVALAERASELKFTCSQPPRIKEPLVDELGARLTPTTELQQFIEERIVRLSKHDIDHTPIIKHIPVPAMPPPLKSQRQLKGVLEEIWCVANRGLRFRGT